jgi:segregation and condensation protein B
MDSRHLQKLGLLEAMLFTTHEPLSMNELEKNLRMRKEDIEALLDMLKQKYSSGESGISLSEIGGCRLVVKSDYVPKVSHLTPHADLSRGLLRVLAIIAYHEPISQSDIVKVVGNRTYEYVKQLEGHGLIKWEKKSRTKILTTTPSFEEYFGTRRADLKKSIADDDKVIVKEQAEELKEHEQAAKKQQPSKNDQTSSQ